ncbi:MAG TPA: hypothetical protein VMT22_24835 [Terriglobales bacterium]|nr:hypothetical protein [Terriglobales bacterium]
MRYAAALRCIGQFLETSELKAIEVKIHGDDYIVQAWNKGTSMAMDLEKQFTNGDLKVMDTEARGKRKPFSGPPNLLSLAQVLRLAGNYVDRMRGRLIRVSWQDQSDKIQSVTVQWEPAQPARESAELQTTTIEELCIHIYKQRKKINLSSEKNAHRPFVSVGRANPL